MGGFSKTGDLASLAGEGSLFAATAAGKLQQLQAELLPLAERYDVVVANPPYMGSNNMNKWLADWTKRAYPDSKRDLCTCFIERGQSLTIDCGYEALITSDTCMYISSFEQLRKNILSRSTIVCFIDTRGTNAHPDVFDANAGWVLHNAFVEGMKGSYFKLNQAIAAKKAGYLEALANPECGWLYRCDTRCFFDMPETPIAYWASPILRESFQYQPLGEIAKPRQGMATCDNERFLRLWPEVSCSKTKMDASSCDEAASSGMKWFPYNKGGEYRKWYGNNDLLINWENDGEEVKALAVEKYGCVTRTIKNIQFYFQSGVTWSTLTVGNLSMRFCPEGFLFDTKGSTCYFEKPELLGYCACLLNSTTADAFLKVLAPTLDYNAGSIAKVPTIICDEETRIIIDEYFNSSVSIAKNDWDSFETSWDFGRHPLI